MTLREQFGRKKLWGTCFVPHKVWLKLHPVPHKIVYYSTHTHTHTYRYTFTYSHTHTHTHTHTSHTHTMNPLICVLVHLSLSIIVQYMSELCYGCVKNTHTKKREQKKRDVCFKFLSRVCPPPPLGNLNSYYGPVMKQHHTQKKTHSAYNFIVITIWNLLTSNFNFFH